MKILGAVVAGLASISIFVTTAKAACDDIPAEFRADGGWLFKMGKTWRPVNKELNDFVGDNAKRVFFTYVVNDKGAKMPRRGLLIVKSGYDLVHARSDGDTQRITLLRNSQRNVEKCETEVRYFKAKVLSDVYDRYHDYGFRTKGKEADVDLIERFHVKYATREPAGCKDSKEARADVYFGGRWTSNRSQFSFDPKVVKFGQHSQFLAWIGISPAYAAPPISDRQVEIKKYVADSDGLACVRFDIKVQPGRFIRINDLEHPGLFREKEQSWVWTE
ncbi:hypothetical protein [Rhizobium rhizogenes]|uniref:Uncharacterized protein n=1 Tax=Rhizobium rhizogenes NBRC 13257 TaxID=1220581 RepID=A0AA87QCX4_RHIRH|nr:hypothetical protein [Rhizobium rhizogenes]NTG71235.1 hypothetical protein [Rhizobium rhizogenes]NTG90542.1 hypothetical protein [Rhizobium rhizogenes]TRB03363.1 hypothetical protein EXN67_28980 [Rhizobium rhizogenes]TRB38105.1 hypothetical protein EXN73_28545 [Rhizobium rhizogenes]TRB53116.1 hypothetical protein EXN71_28530 [Rhizobium rhizogenes]